MRRTIYSLKLIGLVLVVGLNFSFNLLAENESTEKGNSVFNADFNNEPTYISSISLTLHSEKREFVYKKNVELIQGDMNLTSATLEGTYDENNKIIQMTAKTNVIITKGEGIRATGEQGVYESATETFTLTGSPELIQENSVLTADKIIIFLNEDRSEAEGNVRVKIKESNQNNQNKRKN